jgi:hypothetical protein
MSNSPHNLLSPFFVVGALLVGSHRMEMAIPELSILYFNLDAVGQAWSAVIEPLGDTEWAWLKPLMFVATP